jgi:hypothetical protein
MTNSPDPVVGAAEIEAGSVELGSVGVSPFAGKLVSSIADGSAVVVVVGLAVDVLEPPQLALTIETIAMEMGTMILRMGFLGSGSYRVLLVEGPS